MNPIKLTKAMLPNLPDEIFDMFIKQINETEISPFDSKTEGRWFYYFGEISIEAFNHIRWQRYTLTFKETIFHPLSATDIDRLVHYCELEGKPIARTLYPWYPVDFKKALPSY